MALAVSTFIIPVGNDSFAAETAPTEISDSGEGTPSTNDTEENTVEEKTEPVISEPESTNAEFDNISKKDNLSIYAVTENEEVVPRRASTYGLTFYIPGNEFQNAEFQKETVDGDIIPMNKSYHSYTVKSNEKLSGKIVMQPGYELSDPSSYITKGDFTVEKVGAGEDAYLVYHLNDFYLPEHDLTRRSFYFYFRATKAPVDTPPVEEPKEEVKTYTLNLGQMNFADSFEFTAYDPDNPSNSKSVNTKGGSILGIPEGWKLKGEITMKKNEYIMGTGSDLITARDFEMEVIDKGVNNSHVKYTIDNYDIKSNLRLESYLVKDFNHVTYHLNGGTWTDKTLNKQPNLRWNYGDSDQIYQAFITPNQSVYKPTDPTREGYKFLGWKSSSDIGKPAGTNSVHMDKYDFKEVDVNYYSGYAKGGIVHLTAQWEEKKPEFETKTVTIIEGDDFDPNSLIDGDVNYNDDDVNEDKRNVEISGDYDPNTAGEYDVTITVTNGVGGKTTETAKLIVKKKLTPLIPAPKIDASDKTIHVGDDFDPLDMVDGSEEDKKDVTVTLPDDYDPNKPGKYDITFTRSNEIGASVTTTKKLTVLDRKEWTPIIPAPVLEVEDKTIRVGDDFRLTDMIDGDVDDVEIQTPEDFDKNKSGTYEITFIKTNEIGAKVTKTAKLTVVGKLTPIITADLNVQDLEIWEGDEADLELMIQNHSSGTVEIIKPENYAPEKAGTYPITFKLTADNGMTVTKTADLKVKKRLTPLVPSPTLEVEDRTIKVGDDFRLTDMIDGDVDDVEIQTPEGFDKNKPGEYEITFTKTNEDGVKVTKTATLTINPQDEEDPVVHEEKYRTEEAFQIDVKFDPTLESGKVVTDQEGQVGIKEITKKITFKDGKLDSVNTSETPIQEKKNKIIRVGTKFTESEDLKEYGVVIVNYVDEDGLPIKNSIANSVKLFTSEYDTTKDKPETIEFNGKKYELVKVKDGDLEQGTIDEALTQVTYVYKEVEDSETETPDKPGNDTTTPDTEEPGKDGTLTPDTEEDDQEIIPGPNPESETDKEVDESETPDEDDSTDKTDDSTDESDTSDESETTDTTDTTDKDDSPKKPGVSDKPETDDESKIGKDDTDDSSVDKVPVPTPSKTVKTSDNQVSTPTRSVVTKSSDKGASNNVKTGVSGAISVASILALAGAGLYATRNKENEEE